MKAVPDSSFVLPRYPGISMQRVIDGLVGNSLLLAQDHESAIINEVGLGLVLKDSNSRMISLLEQVLHTVILNSAKGDIHIAADREGDKVSLKIQERNNNNGYALAFSLGSLKQDISKAGGDLIINGEQKRVTTITLSFSDRHRA